MLNSHTNFLQELHELKTEAVLQPLQQLIHLDKNIAADVWANLFPVAWKRFSDEQRKELEKPMTKLLCSPWMNKQTPNYRDVIVNNLIFCHKKKKREKKRKAKQEEYLLDEKKKKKSFCFFFF